MDHLSTWVETVRWNPVRPPVRAIVALAVAGWAWADASGYTKRKVIEKENARRQERIDRQRACDLRYQRATCGATRLHFRAPGRDAASQMFPRLVWSPTTATESLTQ